MVSALKQDFLNNRDIESLNPYYTGRWFLLNCLGRRKTKNRRSLNPYYTGRWFLLL